MFDRQVILHTDIIYAEAHNMVYFVHIIWLEVLVEIATSLGISLLSQPSLEVTTY